jgi:hypothetical protein
MIEMVGVKCDLNIVSKRDRRMSVKKSLPYFSETECFSDVGFQSIVDDLKKNGMKGPLEVSFVVHNSTEDMHGMVSVELLNFRDEEFKILRADIEIAVLLKC